MSRLTYSQTTKELSNYNITLSNEEMKDLKLDLITELKVGDIIQLKNKRCYIKVKNGKRAYFLPITNLQDRLTDSDFIGKEDEILYCWGGNDLYPLYEGAKVDDYIQRLVRAREQEDE